jgi:hypothetical protein
MPSSPRQVPWLLKLGHDRLFPRPFQFIICYHPIIRRSSLVFFIRIRGVVELGPLGTSATEWPVVPAPGDCYDGEFGGMKIVMGNRSTRRKPAPASLCPPQIPLARPGLEPGPSR